MHAIAGQRTVFEGVRLISSVFQIVFGELVRIDDQRAAFFQVRKIHLQRRGIHRHQNVGLIARRANVVIGKVQLKAADSG